MFFKTKVVTALRAVFGESNVKASSIPQIPGIVGHILRPGDEADVVFRIDEDELGLFVNCGVLRSDVLNITTRIEDPQSILDVITEYVREWAGVEKQGRSGLRAEQYEKEYGTLTGVDSSEYNGLDEILNPTNPYEDKEVEIKELI